MSQRIEIEHLKNITKLVFRVPRSGVYVLTGENGCGKTTLIACLTRLGHPDSFPRHFKSSTKSRRLDAFEGATVTYIGPSKSVSYRYSGTRWSPTPKGNSKGLLAEFGFSDVRYIAADEKRVSPRQDDFKPSKAKPASTFVVENANKIFDTSKFNNLKVVNVKKGVGQKAFVFEIGSGKDAKYVSERNFSLGEIAVLKLLNSVESSPKGSLVVIDELELALHPLAQERLFFLISSIAADREITAIFSTHSATLIRSAVPAQLLFLERAGDGVVICVEGCYPAYALGRIGTPGESSPDAVLLVEDGIAEHFVKAMLAKSRTKLFKAAEPTVIVSPIGGYEQVVRFQARASAMFPSSTRVASVLDKDCEIAVKDPNWSSAAEFAIVKSRVRFLPETPEVGLMNLLKARWIDARAHLATRFQNQLVHQIPGPTFSGQSGVAADRKAAKFQFESVVTAIEKRLAVSKAEVEQSLFAFYVDVLEKGNDGYCASVLGPCLK